MAVLSNLAVVKVDHISEKLYHIYIYNSNINLFSSAAIEKFISGPVPAAEDPKLKTYMSCIFTDLNIVGPNGNLMLEKLLEQLPDSTKDVALAMAKDCMDLQGTTLEDKVWWLHQCWKKADPVHYFIV